MRRYKSRISVEGEYEIKSNKIMPQVTVRKSGDEDFERGGLFENENCQVFMLCEVKAGIYCFICLESGTRLLADFTTKVELIKYMEDYCIEPLPKGFAVELKN